MRGVGDKIALGGERMVEPSQQIVQRMHQRRDFFWQIAFRNRRERMRAALAHFSGDAAQRF